MTTSRRTSNPPTSRVTSPAKVLARPRIESTMLRLGLFVAMMLVAMLLSACASLTVVDTTPVPPSKLEPPGSETISDGGYRIDSVTRVRQIPDLLILVAMSGGGKRSAAYAYGALKGMGQVTIPGDGRS